MMESRRILFVGDSLIAFFDWQKVFTGFECVNLGVPGETVEGWLHLTAQASNRYPDAEFVILMLGANNLCQQDYSFFPSYQTLLSDLEGLYPAGKIVVCSLLPHALAWLGPSAIPRLNESLQSMVEDNGHVFLDLFSPFKRQGRDCFMADGVHLTEIGYGEWCNVLGSYLND